MKKIISILLIAVFIIIVYVPIAMAKDEETLKIVLDPRTWRFYVWGNK